MIHTNLKVIVVVTGAILLLILSVFYLWEKREKAVAKDEEMGADMADISYGELEIKDYLLPLENSETRSTLISHVMLHFSSNVTEKPHTPYQVDDIHKIFMDYGVSAHYVIDREGVIYKFVQEDRIAYHAGSGSLSRFPAYENKLNAYSIGIELLAIGTKEEMSTFITEDTYDALDNSFIGYTDAQYESLKSLLHTIHERYPEVKRDREHVIGHDEYAPDRKNDPGSLFDWGRIGY